MLLTTLFGSRPSGRSRGPHPRSRCSRQLTLESLENRLLLSYSYVLVADTGGHFGSFPNRPSINADGVVAFTASIRSGGAGVFTQAPDGPLHIIATTSDLVSAFTSAGIVNREGTVSFGVNLRAGGAARVTGNGGPLTIIARTGGYSPFSSFFGVPVINDGGTVAFGASLTKVDGIFTGRGQAPSLLYATGGFFGSFFGGGVNTPINNAGVVAFRGALTGGGEGIYRGNGVSTTVIADTTEDRFSEFSSTPSLNDAGTVAFQVNLTEGRAILTGNGGALTTVADTSGPYSSFEMQTAINNTGTVVFEATLRAGGRGLFTGPDPAVDKVLAVGDALFNSTVTSVLCLSTRCLNDAGQLALRVELANGRQVILRADAEAMSLEDRPPVAVWALGMPDVLRSDRSGLSRACRGDENRLASQDGLAPSLHSAWGTPLQRASEPASALGNPVRTRVSDQAFVNLEDNWANELVLNAMAAAG